MNWQEHQAILVAHDDKRYPHVHVMLNAVHPETGLQLNDGFEQRRAQAWALDYEREQGHIHCEQRLKNRRGARKEHAAQYLDGLSGKTRRNFRGPRKILRK